MKDDGNRTVMFPFHVWLIVAIWGFIFSLRLASVSDELHAIRVTLEKQAKR